MTCPRCGGAVWCQRCGSEVDERPPVLIKPRRAARPSRGWEMAEQDTGAMSESQARQYFVARAPYDDVRFLLLWCERHGLGDTTLSTTCRETLINMERDSPKAYKALVPRLYGQWRTLMGQHERGSSPLSS